MIRQIVLIIIGISAFVLTSADYKKLDPPATTKKFCRGYSVIEADKGIDCHGDTIKLVKVNGFFERESKSKEPT
jgi:hypothetical protein